MASASSHVSPTPTPELRAKAAQQCRPDQLLGTDAVRAVGGDTATSAAYSRPLRLRVRKVEAAYLPAIETGAKRYDITQQRYLGTAAHGWSLGWDVRSEVVVIGSNQRLAHIW